MSKARNCYGSWEHINIILHSIYTIIFRLNFLAKIRTLTGFEQLFILIIINNFIKLRQYQKTNKNKQKQTKTNYYLMFIVFAFFGFLGYDEE